MALIEALIEKNSSNEQSTKEETSSSEEPEIQSEIPEENKIDIPIEALNENNGNLLPASIDSNSEVEPAPTTSRRNSRKKNSETNTKREMSTGTSKKSFDKNVFDKEL